jgi:16S rRNA (guanine527-N7)-methyltransferase
VLDSLAVIQPLRCQCALQGFDLEQSMSLMDVGAGAGLPGVVVAICFPGVQVHCVDAVAKKAAFVQQVAASLAIKNLRGVHSRVEDVATKFQVVTSRAFASLANFTSISAHTLVHNGIWMAMKGKMPADEIDALPVAINMFHVEQLQVPGLDAERCLVWMQPRPPSA